jgi:hypothetical protein
MQTLENRDGVVEERWRGALTFRSFVRLSHFVSHFLGQWAGHLLQSEIPTHCNRLAQRIQELDAWGASFNVSRQLLTKVSGKFSVEVLRQQGKDFLTR